MRQRSDLHEATKDRGKGGYRRAERVVDQEAAARDVLPGRVLTPAGVRTLQRHVGNAATAKMLSGGATVHRYSIVNAGYKQEGRGPKGRAQFPYQAKDPELDPDTLAAQWKSGKLKSPALRVADDATLAIAANDKEHKAFYASPGAIARANGGLEASSSPVRLVLDAGNAIKIPKQPGRDVTELTGAPGRRGRTPRTTLQQVTPTNDAGGVLALATSVCRDVAKTIMGGAHSSVLLGHRGGERRAIETQAGNTSFSGAESVYSAMAGGTRLADVESVDDAGADKQEYADLDPGVRDTRAAELAVNQFARADVGESYVINAAGLAGEVGFGYHAAAVVANSLDGNDHMTLENYNRGPTRKKLLKEVRRVLEARDAEQTKAAKDAFEGPNESRGDEDLFTVGYLLFNGGGVAIDALARTVMDRLSASLGPLNNRAWYFAMFGSQQGQSFHEVNKADYGAGAMTMVTSSADIGSTIGITFAHESSIPDALAFGRLVGLAADWTRLTALGAPARVTVTVYWATHGGKRADQRLGVVLGELERHGVRPEGVVTRKQKVDSKDPKNRKVEVLLDA